MQQPADDSALVNPYAAPLAFTARPPQSPSSRGARPLWSMLSSIQLACVAVAIVAAFVDIETIVFSGPFLSLTGLGLVLIAALGRGGNSQRVAVIVLGLSTPAISLFCFLLILVLDWSPGEAQVPVSTIALLYGLAAAGVWLWVILSHVIQRAEPPPDSAVAEGL